MFTHNDFPTRQNGRRTPHTAALRCRSSARTAHGVCLLLCLVAGCAAYHVGNASLFPPDIHTVYVPMFESDSFRKNLGEMLTEAVAKEIESRTPFKVVGTPNADSVLTGRIIGDTKHPLVREPNNEAREIEIGLAVKVAWADRRGSVIRQGAVPIPADMVTLTQASNLIPEYGASSVSAEYQDMKRLAKQIVDLMETPW
jgi:hypothetical protein